MKTVGIITMHKVLNYGSVLQAHATQQALEKLGVSCEIIDYIFPNKFHKKTTKTTIAHLRHFASELYTGFAQIRKQKYFNAFYREHLNLSKQTYNSPAEIFTASPIYDVYMVGSDQTWYVHDEEGDKVFFLSFAPKGAKKISYASSFGPVSTENKRLQELKNELNEFSALSVRERNGQKVIADLIQKKADICLDPTLLLNKEEWGKLAQKSTLKIKKAYVLVYILKYAYNPYPFVVNFIKKVREKTGLHIVLLSFEKFQELETKDITYLHDGVSPCDFLSLFQNASLIVTNSFHGTAFALNFERLFFSIINDKMSSDDRMFSLLQEVDAENQAIKCNSEISDISLEMDYEAVSKKLQEKRDSSIEYLRNNIKTIS
ncbi:MAG: polysaccharide pyruvyl transferase family protein [Prevotellaceae bacterium]|jgi:hypothetical protein|nr:polysaccharide pyruvyl transferase family protein [Prevotellaceae bacterium]